MKQEGNQDAGFREFWDCEFDEEAENPMLKITRASRTAYASFISLIGQALIGCSKWRRFLDMGSIQGYALSDTISTADEPCWPCRTQGINGTKKLTIENVKT